MPLLRGMEMMGEDISRALRMSMAMARSDGPFLFLLAFPPVEW